MTHRSNQIIWDEARRYLLNNTSVTDEMIELHLSLYKRKIPKSINDIYRGLISSLTNRQGVSNWIGDLNRLEPFFGNYSPITMITKWPDWESFLDSIIKSDFDPPSTIRKDDNRNIWVLFSKGVITGARFLNSFGDHKSFNTYVEQHIKNQQHIQLANNISRKVHGYGFALSCDFLKELGYSDYVKPDTHIIEIFNALGLSQSEKGEDIFRDVLRFSVSIGEIPYRVDKLFWLIGSGKFYLLNKQITTDKFEFCRKTRDKLQKMGLEVKPVTIRKRTLKQGPDKKYQEEFRTLNKILTTLRRAEKITAEEYRRYSKKWQENPSLRDELIQDLTIMKDN